MKPLLSKPFTLTIFLSLFLVPFASAGIVDYTYDNAGQLTESKYGSGKLIQYTYDNAGNLAQKTISDTTSPDAPTVAVATPTNDTTPSWNWVSGGGGNGTFRYKPDDPDLTTGATETTDTSYTACGLSAGNHTLYIQEQMSARGPDAPVWSSATAVTIAVSGAAPIRIPMFSQWGMFALAVLFMMSGILLARRRRR